MSKALSEQDRLLLAAKLKEMRLAHGYKQADIAGAIDIKQATYSNYETGKRTPGSMILYRIASFYGLKSDDLLRLSIHLDDNVFYDAPEPNTAVQEEEEYLTFRNNKSKKDLSPKEALLLFHFSKLTTTQQDEIISYT